MALTWLDPAHLDDRDVAGAVAVLEASRALEAPHEKPVTPNWYRAHVAHGWDGEPPESSVYRDESGRVIAVLEVSLPRRDNTHAADIQVTVDPVCRRRGLGRDLWEVGLGKAGDDGRTLVLSDGWADAAAPRFLAAMGLTRATEYVNRVQDVLAMEWSRLERGLEAAAAKAEGYELVRLPEKVPDDMIDQVVRMTTAINDAPLDDLKLEDEVFTPERIRSFETAQAAHGRRMYRLVAREKATGEFAGHTMVAVQADRPWQGEQFDTSVLSAHRGRRLGYQLKAAMLFWLREEEPQIREVSTWNAASNDHMIGVNEELGYRVVATAVGFQRDFAEGSPKPE
jgi:GNAT superfamily N-acetyltransferase